MSKNMTIEQRILDVVEEPLGLWAVQRNKRELRAIAFEVRKREDRIKQLEDRIKRLEEAGDALAKHHLLVVTTYDKAKAHVADWRKAKEAKP